MFAITADVYNQELFAFPLVEAEFCLFHNEPVTLCSMITEHEACLSDLFFFLKWKQYLGGCHAISQYLVHGPNHSSCHLSF